MIHAYKEHYLDDAIRNLGEARLTQKELADRSGVKLRTIQQYEMRTKNINKAAAETLQQLAQVLLCSIEDLLEYDC